MKRLTEELKRVLSGLACQDAGEFLTMQDKLEVLGYASATGAESAAIRKSAPKRTATYRIGLVSDGRGLGAPLEYAIEAAKRQHARIDLLTHGTFDARNLDALKKRVMAERLECQVIRLGVEPVEDIVGYICNHPSLVFLVAMPDDSAARVLVEEVIPRRGGRIPVPLVLIEARKERREEKLSAA